jgi:hypothetical protein
MALSVKTSDPKGLLKSIYEAIDKKSIKTWAYNPEKYFVHTSPQWIAKGKGWLVPKVTTDSLELQIKTSDVKSEDCVAMYSMYFSSFAEMLLYHFREKFESVTITAKPIPAKPKPTLSDLLKKNM